VNDPKLSDDILRATKNTLASLSSGGGPIRIPRS
jgi:hypothetical protein